MAISRAQLLKELLPGLNALFGLEYAKYGEQHKEIYETETSERSFEEETKLSGFSAAPVKNEGAAIAYDNAQTCTTASPAATPRLWPVVWLTPSRLKLLPS
jgi:hypothetical protein